MNTVEMKAPGRLTLTGAVDVDTAAELERAGLNLMDDQVTHEWVADLSAVTRADSAALAMMLSWMREAGRKNIHLVFAGLPDELMALAGVCGVDALLPMA